MSNIDDICYEGEEIKLKGKTRKLLYTTRGMKILAQKFGTVYKGLNILRGMDFEFDESSLENMAVLLYAGLAHEDKSLTLEDVEDMMRFDLMPYIIEKVSKAVSASLPVVGNAQTQPETEK
jgi:hypothetical protein